jgi:hypothetical protein
MVIYSPIYLNSKIRKYHLVSIWATKMISRYVRKIDEIFVRKIRLDIKWLSGDGNMYSDPKFQREPTEQVSQAISQPFNIVRQENHIRSGKSLSLLFTKSKQINIRIYLIISYIVTKIGIWFGGNHKDIHMS